MAIVIAGERSGVGKTTVTLALLAALARRRGATVQAFKVGPDFIDPMFHQFVTGRASRNLDPVLTSEAYVQQIFQQYSRQASYSLVEGVMGLFDGITGKSDWASTAHLARLLKLPIVLVLNCNSTSRSIAAIAHGYRTFDPRLEVVGVVLNRVGSDRHLELLQDALAPLNLPILGVLHRQDEITIPDRYLGLVPTAELPALGGVIDRLAYLGETCFQWDLLEPLLRVCQTATIGPELPQTKPEQVKVRLALARDRAFSFYYADHFDLLTAAGIEWVEWSPMDDTTLPAGIQGLYFGGGFPEVFAATLAENQRARHSVREAIQAGLPTYAECGGLMYLCEQIVDFNGQSYPMVGLLPATAHMGKSLTIGYRQATAQQSTSLVKAGDILWGHEFHRSYLTPEPNIPLFTLVNYEGKQSKREGWSMFNLHASYLHLHFGSQPQLLKRWYTKLASACIHMSSG